MSSTNDEFVYKQVESSDQGESTTGQVDLSEKTKPSRPDPFAGAKKALMNAADKNQDGKVDAADAGIVAQKIGTSFKKAGVAVRDTVKENLNQASIRRDDAQWEKDRKTLCPIFADDLEKEDFCLPKLIRIAPMDKQHKNSSACQNSIGHETELNGLSMVTIYPNKKKEFHLSFHPYEGGEFYYANPYVSNSYLALDEYFSFLFQAQESELVRIFGNLGAKSVIIHSLHDVERKESSEQTSKAKILAPDPAADIVTVGAESSKKGDSISAEKNEAQRKVTFPGKDPCVPELVYFKNDVNIENLIKMRMSDNPVMEMEYRLNVGKSSGMTQKDAKKITAAVEEIGCELSFELIKNAQKEEKNIIDYKVQF